MKKLILSGLVLLGIYSHIESMRLELENDSILLRHLIKNNNYESLKSYLIKKDKFESDINKFLIINNKILNDYLPVQSPIMPAPKAISECPICLEPVLSTQESYLFPCNDTRHAMHFSCYSEAHSDVLERCPSCRR